MARTPDGAAARDVVIGVRITKAGLEALDKARGPVSRSEFIRRAIRDYVERSKK